MTLAALMVGKLSAKYVAFAKLAGGVSRPEALLRVLTTEDNLWRAASDRAKRLRGEMLRPLQAVSYSEQKNELEHSFASTPSS